MVVFDRKSMVLAENEVFKSGVSQETLMENAGNSVAEVILSENDLKNKNIAVVCGKGNNGGDGFVVARKLYKKGAKVTVILVSNKKYEGAAKTTFDKIPKRVKKLLASQGLDQVNAAISKSDILVDALFGFSFKGEIKEPEKSIVKAINSSKAPVYSIDIPSGAEADNGKILSDVVKADCTVTFETLKLCHILPPANSYSGKIIVKEIGIDKKIIEKIQPALRVTERVTLPKRDKNAHKGTSGTMISVCGSYGMPGAAVLAAKAALRTGVGKLFAVCPPENYDIMGLSVPEAVLLPLCFEEETKAVLEKLPLADSLLIGCGIGTSIKKEEAVKELISFANCPVIIDADGINNICHDIDFIKKVKADVVFTPHAGEMARLTGLSISEVEENRLEIASAFAKENGVYLCLKGANTIIATPEGELFVNMTGTPALATAGSGDVLSGIIASLIAGGLDTLSAITFGVFVHGLSGEMAAQKLGERGILAGDIIENLPYLL